MNGSSQFEFARHAAKIGKGIAFVSRELAGLRCQQR